MFRGAKSLLLGLIAGTALGVLFAPKKGQELRKSIKSEINKGGTGMNTLKSSAAEMGKDIKNSAGHAYSKLEKNPNFKKAKGFVDRVSDKLKDEEE